MEEIKRLIDEQLRQAEWHCHTDRSNLISRDSINTPEGLINKALEMDIEGIALTEHGNLSSHIKGIKHLKKLRAEAEENYKKEPSITNEDWLNKVNNFKLALGIEIYLVDRKTVEFAKEKNMPTKFYHFILLAKNLEGFRALCELSSNSWEEAFYFRGVQRVPVYKDFFFEWLERNKGNIVGSTACLGSEFANLVLSYIAETEKEEVDEIEVTKKILEINQFVAEFKNLLGEDFYVELQPSPFEEQIKYNKVALDVAKANGVKTIITTDAHYSTAEMREIHSNYLKSQNAERETETFYFTTHLMSIEEKRQYFDYLTAVDFKICLDNTIEIKNKIQDYDVKMNTQVPHTSIQLEMNRGSILEPIIMNSQMMIEKYPFIVKYLNSTHFEDKILIQEIEKGLIEKQQPNNHKVLSRINEELEALWKISENLHQRLSSYYVLTKEIVMDMWEVSLVGVSRGSAGAFYLCYLLGITGINALEHNLPSWRHISETRPELP